MSYKGLDGLVAEKSYSGKSSLYQRIKNGIGLSLAGLTALYAVDCGLKYYDPKIDRQENAKKTITLILDSLGDANQTFSASILDGKEGQEKHNDGKRKIVSYGDLSGYYEKQEDGTWKLVKLLKAGKAGYLEIKIEESNQKS